MESAEDSSPQIVATPPILAGAWGERGLAPYFRADAKIEAPKLALASAKPALTVRLLSSHGSFYHPRMKENFRFPSKEGNS
jgi:hypothetical protein